MMNLNDVNIENAVNTLHSMFQDIDKEVIRIILWNNVGAMWIMQRICY